MAGTESSHEQPDAQHGAQRVSGRVISHIFAQNDNREVTLKVGQRDIRIRRSCWSQGQTEQKRRIRNQVTAFSDGSKRRLLFTARNFPGMDAMLTLTYPADFPMNGRLVKDHWKRFRQWLIRNDVVTGLWVLEFQKRGAPHFHIFLRDYIDRHKIAEAWYRIVGSGDPKHLSAGTRIENFRHPPLSSVLTS